MKLIEISWNFIFWKLMKTLILKHFEIRWNKWCSNQVLRKLVKHHNLVNVNSRELLYLQRAPFGVFFFYTFLLNWCNWHSCCDFSRLQMWLQPDKVSCLKTLINTIISTFQSTQEFTSWVLFYIFWKSPPQNLPYFHLIVLETLKQIHLLS